MAVTGFPPFLKHCSRAIYFQLGSNTYPFLFTFLPGPAQGCFPFFWVDGLPVNGCSAFYPPEISTGWTHFLPLSPFAYVFVSSCCFAALFFPFLGLFCFQFFSLNLSFIFCHQPLFLFSFFSDKPSFLSIFLFFNTPLRIDWSFWGCRLEDSAFFPFPLKMKQTLRVSSSLAVAWKKRRAQRAQRRFSRGFQSLPHRDLVVPWSLLCLPGAAAPCPSPLLYFENYIMLISLSTGFFPFSFLTVETYLSGFCYFNYLYKLSSKSCFQEFFSFLSWNIISFEQV